MTLARAHDWKVTTAYRLLLRAAWLAVIGAVLLVVVAAILGVHRAWWAAAGLAALALAIGAFLPEPVPRHFITGGRNHIDTRRLS
jgi:Na+/H+ antiporter NhaD/arsenite permease-like protein